jgi:hypothetical protein
MNPSKFYNSTISISQMSAVRGGNDEPIKQPEVIVLLPPPPDAV